jgi:UDP-2,3-diacylglucosamine pyrophosphatase LpxH
MGLEYWSLSAYLKYKVKKAVAFIDDFETTLVRESRKRGYQGVICGHIHHPEVRMIGEITYGNSGDWVESCSALVEDFEGGLNIMRWLPSQQASQSITEASEAA